MWYGAWDGSFKIGGRSGVSVDGGWNSVVVMWYGIEKG